MIQALLYLRSATLRNWLKVRLRRLREPKYLAGAIAGAAYIYYFFVRSMRMPIAAGPHGGPRGSAVAMGMGIGVAANLILIPAILLVFTFLAWIAPSKRTGLNFSEAEISFLFPAPIKRRMLVHYHLLSSQLMLGLAAIVLGIVWSGRGMTAAATAMHVIGWWILFSASSLHRIAAGLTQARLAERGVNPLRVRAAAAGVAVLVIAAFVLAFRATPWPAPADWAGGPSALTAYVSRAIGRGPLGWVLLPVRLVAGPFLASDGPAFLASLPLALAILAVHYRWILGVDVSFAEGSIDLAERRARARAEPLAGPLARRRTKAGGDPFRLGPRGRQETAFLWKNLISISVVNWRFLIVLALLGCQGLAIAIVLSSGRRHGAFDPALLVALGAAILAAYLLLVGPQIAQQDFRQDLANVDMLKVLPIPGWRVALGELLAPAGLLTCLLWILLAAAAWALGLSPGHSLGLSGVERTTLALCAAAVAPFVCGLELLVPNAAALYFPGWFRGVRTRVTGFENFGQRLIFAFGQLFLIVLALFPAVATAPLVVFASRWLIGLAPAVVLATVSVLAILGGELAVGIWLLGVQFEKLDLSTDLGPA